MEQIASHGRAPQPKAKMEGGQHVSINHLNNDVLALVLSFLPIKDCLLTADLVSKAFHESSKHPMCWDSSLKLTADLPIPKSVTFLLKHHRCPELFISVQRLSRVSLCALSRLTDLRRLTLWSLAADAEPTITDALSSFRQLERFAVVLRGISFSFPSTPMPHLARVELHSTTLAAIVNMDSAHLPCLSYLYINAESRLMNTSFPESLRELALAAHVSSLVAANIAKLPNLQSLSSFAANCLSPGWPVEIRQVR